MIKPAYAGAIVAVLFAAGTYYYRLSSGQNEAHVPNVAYSPPATSSPPAKVAALASVSPSSTPSSSSAVDIVHDGVATATPAAIVIDGVHTRPATYVSSLAAQQWLLPSSYWHTAWSDGRLVKVADKSRREDPYLTRYLRKLVGQPKQLSDVLVLVPMAGASLDAEMLSERYDTVAIDCVEFAARYYWKRLGRPFNEASAVVASAVEGVDATVPVTVLQSPLQESVDPLTGQSIRSPTLTYIVANVTELSPAMLRSAGVPRDTVTAIFDRHGLDAIDPSLRSAYAAALTRVTEKGARLLTVVHDDSADCASCAVEEAGAKAAADCDSDDYLGADDDRIWARKGPQKPPFSVYRRSLERLFGSSWSIEKLMRSPTSGEVVYLLTRK